jgi:hypothetical protein
MKIRDLLESWGLKNLKLSAGFVAADFGPKDPDRDAAWDLYVELVTRVATQKLPIEDGDEKTALKSIYDLWGFLRASLKAHRGCVVFAKLVIPFFNQQIRPFTAKWHRASLGGALDNDDGRRQFRTELEALREDLVNFAGLLSSVAGVEDISPDLLASAQAAAE